jgi:hypothetical protein
MRLTENMVPAGSRIESDPSQMDQAGGARSLRAQDVQKIRLGMPEHAALLEALRREFPEIYGRLRRCDGGRRL